MKSVFVLVGYCAATLVAAELTEYSSGLFSSYPFLRIRDLDDGEHFVRRGNRPSDRRGPLQRISSSSSSSSSAYAGASLRDSSPARASNSGSGGHAPASFRGAGIGSSKGHILVDGPGTLSTGGRMQIHPSMAKVKAGEARLVNQDSSSYVHFQGGTEPPASGGSTGKRWGTKATVTGKGAVAIVEAPEGGRGHMRLTSPDEPAQEIHVPGGARRIAAVNSQTPGKARIRAAVSPGGLVDVGANDRQLDKDALKVAGQAYTDSGTHDPSAGLPTQFGKMSVKE